MREFDRDKYNEVAGKLAKHIENRLEVEGWKNHLDEPLSEEEIQMLLELNDILPEHRPIGPDWSR